MAERKPRKVLYRGGRRGDQVKAVVDPSKDAVIVYYRDVAGIARKKLFANSKEGRDEAKMWAQTFHAERERQREAAKAPKAKKPPITHEQLWEAYSTSPAYLDLREKSRTSYAERWRRWERFRHGDTFPDDTTLHHVDQFRTEARAAGIALNQIRNAINVARIVYNWGQSRELVNKNILALYRWRTPKDVEEIAPGEYTDADIESMLRRRDPSHSHQWRPWVALLLGSAHGQRAHAVRHLRWRDVDFERGMIVWPAQYQKQGKKLERPITWDVFSALLVAQLHRRKEVGDREVGTDWILFAMNRKDQPYSYSSLHYQLTEVMEKGAGIEHEAYRAFHGARRGRVSTVIEATGDRMLGLEAVGDIDPKQLKAYDKRREQRAQRAIEEAEAAGRQTRRPTGSVPKVSPETTNAAQGGAGGPNGTVN